MQQQARPTCGLTSPMLVVMSQNEQQQLADTRLESHLRSWGSLTTASPANLSWSWWRWCSCPTLPFHLIYPLVLQLLKKNPPRIGSSGGVHSGKLVAGWPTQPPPRPSRPRALSCPTPTSSHLGAAGMCEGAGPVDPWLQDPCDSEQQQTIWKSLCGCNIGVAASEVRGFQLA